MTIKSIIGKYDIQTPDLAYSDVLLN